MRAAGLGRHHTSGGPTPPNFFSLTSLGRPSFTPGRTVNFSTKAGLDAAITGLQSGDLIQYNGSGVLTISASAGSSPYTFANLNPGLPVVFDFGVPLTSSMTSWGAPTTANYVKFSYTGTSQVDAVTISNCSNIRFFGGEYTSGNFGNCAIRLFGLSHDLYIWDAYASKSGSHGIQIVSKTTGGTNSQIYNLNLRIEVNRFCMNPGLDSHADKGSGIHAVELHGGGTTRDTVIIAHGHDPLLPGETSAGQTWPEGGGSSVVECGMDVPGVNFNFTIYALGENLLMVPDGTNPGSTGGGQIGGHVIEGWGNAPLDNYVFGWIEGRNCTGSNFHCQGSGVWYPGTPAIRVLHGRHTNINQSTINGNGAPNNVPYPTGFGIVYSDCT